MGLTAVQTRQKTGVLFSSERPIDAGASVGFGPAEIDGYSSISILILSDQPFSINLFEAGIVGGPYELSQSFTSTSSGVGIGPGFMIAQRFIPTGSFLRMTLQNLSAARQMILSLLVQGNPAP